MGFYIAPDDVAKYIPLFRSLPAWWQLVIVIGVAALVSGIIGWRIVLGHYRERIETQKVIIDDYREKLKGLSPSEASQQIQRLEAEIGSMQWRTLTLEQKSLFREAIPADAKASLWKVYCVATNAEAESYIKQLLYMFYDSRVYLSDYEYYEIAPSSPSLDRYGLVLLARNVNSLSAQRMKHAFDTATIDYYLTSEGVSSSTSDDFLAIRVGPKPKCM